MRLQILALALLAMACAELSVAAEQTEQSPASTTGLVAERPDEGPAVQVDGGFMVPYTETIPGTDVTFEMVPVPGGEFLLGSPEDEQERSEDEGPQVRIAVAPMWVGRCEVTWAEYRAYMDAYGHFKRFEQLVNAGASEGDGTPLQLIKQHAIAKDAEGEVLVDAITSPTPLYDASYTFSAGDAPDQPAATMTPYAARQYTKWLSGLTGRDYRLPTEAEWEYAARAGTETAYYFGDDPAELEDHAWIDDNADWETHPVGSKSPNPWGLFDVLGNVAELTLDEYDAEHYAALADEQADVLPAEQAVNWPQKLFPRVARGGSWLAFSDRCRSAARLPTEEKEWKLSDPNLPLSPWWYTEEPALGVGMRIVRPLAGIPDEDKPRVWDAAAESVVQDVQIRVDEGRAVRGRATPKLPEAVKAAKELGE